MKNNPNLHVVPAVEAERLEKLLNTAERDGMALRVKPGQGIIDAEVVDVTPEDDVVNRTVSFQRHG